MGKKYSYTFVFCVCMSRFLFISALLLLLLLLERAYFLQKYTKLYLLVKNSELNFEKSCMKSNKDIFYYQQDFIIKNVFHYV